MRGALAKTRQTLSTDIRDLFKSEGRLVDDEFLGELFSRLIRTDMGVSCAEAIRDDVEQRLKSRVVQMEEVLETITEQTKTMLEQESSALLYSSEGPTVILVVGVNGSGKTTSIGKLAKPPPSIWKTNCAWGGGHLSCRCSGATHHLGRQDWM